MFTPVRITCAVISTIALASGQSKASAPTAREIVERIKAHLGIPWRDQTVDAFKAGDPDTPVTGIATTMMATFDVLKRAAASGKNLIITHEPTFYSHLDSIQPFQQENDPVWAEKEKFIRDHKLVVWRFHDHWHARRPDGILEGMTKALGWQRLQSAANPALYTAPEITLEDLAGMMRHKLDIRIVRVVGRREMKVTHIAMLPGAAGPAPHRRVLQREDVEVLVIGEAPEWETIEYVSDAVAEGKRKALILLGHIPSEQAGMAECADWLTSFITEVPVAFLPAAEPFWLAP